MLGISLLILFSIFGSPNTDITYHPRIGDLKIGNFVWMPSSRFYSIYKHYSTSEPQLDFNTQNHNLRFENPKNQNFTLISQYIFVKSASLNLSMSFKDLEYYSSNTQNSRIVIRLIDGDNVITTKSYLIAKSSTIKDTYGIGNLKSTLKIEIDFDANIKKGTVTSIDLNLSNSKDQIEKKIPKYYSITNHSFYSQNENIIFHTKFLNGHSSSDSLKVQLFNSNNELKYSGIKSINDSVTSLGKLDIGWYTLITSYYHNGSSNIISEYEFPVTPDPVRKTPSELSPFGIHVGFNKEGLKIIKYLGAGWTRVHGTEILSWKTIENKKGDWAFPDSMINLFYKASISILGNLGETPAWASSFIDTTNELKSNYYFGSAAYMPNDINDWKNYIKTVVSRYKGKINYWEIWNEPDIDFFKIQKDSKAEEYIKLLKTDYSEIKLIDSSAKILAPAVAYYLVKDPAYETRAKKDIDIKKTRDPDFLKGFFGNGGNNYYDIFSFHHYTTNVENNGVLRLISNNKLKNINAPDYNVSKEKWVTEYNFIVPFDYYNSDIDNTVANQLCIEHFELLANDISKIFTFNGYFNDYPTGKNFNFFYDKNPRQVFLAYSIMTWKLDNLKYKSEMYINNNDVKVYTFGNQDEVTKIYYSLNKESEVPAPGNGVITDCLGYNYNIKEGQSFKLKANKFVYFTNK